MAILVNLFHRSDCIMNWEGGESNGIFCITKVKVGLVYHEQILLIQKSGTVGHFELNKSLHPQSGRYQSLISCYSKSGIVTACSEAHHIMIPTPCSSMIGLPCYRPHKNNWHKKKFSNNKKKEKSKLT